MALVLAIVWMVAALPWKEQRPDPDGETV